MEKEGEVVYSVVLNKHLPGDTEGNDKKYQ